uniref:Uncharacterized protein n=1 Tax=Setaria italica TaxID=4555 RepID=K3YXC4_SETIT
MHCTTISSINCALKIKKRSELVGHAEKVDTIVAVAGHNIAPTPPLLKLRTKTVVAWHCHPFITFQATPTTHCSLL